MQELNLPSYEPRLRDNEIFCTVRKKWIVLTPEEWVRQHFINLLFHLKYPPGMIKLEYTHVYFRSGKRSDILVLDQDGQPFLLVECKSAEVSMSQQVVNQVFTYNKTIRSKYVAISNGLQTFIWVEVDGEYSPQSDFPSYQSG